MKWLPILFLLLLVALPIVAASELNTEISSADKEKFDEILSPVMKIYNLIKYTASFIAVIFVMIAGVTFMSSGSDPRQRDKAKSMATYIIVGMAVIWAAPYMVNLLIT